MQLIKEQVSTEQILLLAPQWHDASHPTWQTPQGKDPPTELRATQDPSRPETLVLGLRHSQETTRLGSRSKK